jgi:hypothetical protein
MGTVPVIGRKSKKSGNSKAGIACDLPVHVPVALGEVIDFQVGKRFHFNSNLSCSTSLCGGYQFGFVAIEK